LSSRLRYFGAEDIEALGVVLRDVGMAEGVADERAVFALDQGIVIRFCADGFW